MKGPPQHSGCCSKDGLGMQGIGGSARDPPFTAAAASLREWQLAGVGRRLGTGHVCLFDYE